MDHETQRNGPEVDATDAPPYRDADGCLEAWFAVLGSMTGTSTDRHPSGILPVVDRMPGLSRVADRTERSRRAGITVPALDLFDALELDLLDRLLVLALMRDLLDARGRPGVTLNQLCDASGAAEWTLQQEVRSRLEESGSLRRFGLVQSDADRHRNERHYRLHPTWRPRLLEGTLSPSAATAPALTVSTSPAARLERALFDAGLLLHLVAPDPREAVLAWSDPLPDRAGWDAVAPARRRLLEHASVYVAPPDQTASDPSDPIAIALRDARASSLAEAALLLMLLSRPPGAGPVAWALLGAALAGIDGAEAGMASLAGPTSPLGQAKLLEITGDPETKPGPVDGPLTAFRVPPAARQRIVPAGLASVTRESGEGRATVDGIDASATAERITPRRTLSDLVLTPSTRAQLEDALAVPQGLAAAADWGTSGTLLGSTGVVLLLYGPPGTGKTLAAEAIAGELGRTLWRLRTDQLLSRWVGDTEKQIAAVFQAARAADGVVLLDEADSLLGHRDQAVQRWEVSMTNLLLQEIDSFPGVAVLTTNRDTALDPALERRLLARLEFALPGPLEREKLWERHLPPRAPRAADVSIPELARTYPLTGSLIRTATLLAVAKAAARPESRRILTRADLHDSAAAQLARSRSERPPAGFAPVHNLAPRLALVAGPRADRPIASTSREEV